LGDGDLGFLTDAPQELGLADGSYHDELPDIEGPELPFDPFLFGLEVAVEGGGTERTSE
jgi:hypothetical protein